MKYFRIFIILLLLTSRESFECSFSQPPNTTICWGVLILRQLETFFHKISYDINRRRRNEQSNMQYNKRLRYIGYSAASDNLQTNIFEKAR